MMASDAHARIEMLERTLMELGSEIFHMKGIVARSQESQAHMISLVKSLKQLLDDKGVINGEDFDAAIDLTTATRAIDAQHEAAIIEEMERQKKTGH